MAEILRTEEIITGPTISFLFDNVEIFEEKFVQNPEIFDSDPDFWTRCSAAGRLDLLRAEKNILIPKPCSWNYRGSRRTRSSGRTRRY
jgi:hypothetical protein